MIAAIGDVHGQYKTLRTLINKIPKEAEIILLGDLFDKGDDSKNVYSFLLDTEHERILGNHDQMLIDAVAGKGAMSMWKWMMSGGRFTMKSFGGIPDAKIIEFLLGSHLFIEKNDIIFVHAGIRPGVSIKDQKKTDLLNIRSRFYCAKSTGIDQTVVFGHTPFQSVLIRDNMVGCDTGAGMGNKLSAVIFDGLDVPYPISVDVEY